MNSSPTSRERTHSDEATALLGNRPVRSPSRPTTSGFPQPETPRPAINPLAREIQRQGLNVLDNLSFFPCLESPAEESTLR